MFTESSPVSSNPFLDPILARWKSSPERLVGIFLDGDEDWREIDNATFMRRTLQFAGLFADANVADGDIALIILEHGVDAHAAFIGAMLAGTTPGFMPSPNVKQDAQLYWLQHRKVFTHTRPRVILTYDTILAAVTEAAEGSGATVIAASAVDRVVPQEPELLPGADATALLQHSSGTTGLKKGVMLSYRAITLQLDAYQQTLGLKSVPDARFASWLPLYHDMGLISSFLMPIWLGIPILSVDPFEWTRRPSLIFDAIQDFRATHSWVPNFALLHHVRSARGNQAWDLSSLRAIICCSEPNKPAAFDSFVERFGTWGVTPATLQTCYAMAETVFAVTQSPIGEPVRRLLADREALQTSGFVEVPKRPEDGISLLSNGPAIPGCTVRILKDDSFIGDDIVGEVCVTASFLFSGYYNNQPETDRVFRGEWLRTGDLGFLNGGDLFIVGRTKDIIIINGKNIVAHDVEAAISRLPQIKGGRAVAFGHYVESLGSEQLVVVAERLDPQDDSQATIRMISNAVSMEIGISCGDIRLVDQGWLIKTTSGKISRSENLRKYVDSFVTSN